nr:hypothetical protein [Tanacetum cinerariifolium]
KAKESVRFMMKESCVKTDRVICDNVANEAIYKELDDSLVRVATTASSLKAKQDSARVDSSDDEQSLSNEDASKQGRKIDDIEFDEGIILVDETAENQERFNDEEMFDAGVLDDEEMFVKQEGVVKYLTVDEVTLAQALAALKSIKPKAKRIVFKELGPSDTPLCYLCTCELCGNILINGTCSKCNSRAGNSFTYDPIPKSFNEVQSIFNPPPQSHYKIYLCQLCKSNSQYGYECSQRVLLVYEPKLCYNQNFGDTDYPHDSPGTVLMMVTIAHHMFLLSKLCQVFHNNILVMKIMGILMKLFNYSVNPSLNVQNKLNNHELFINELIQQKLQNEYAQPFPAIAIIFDLPNVKPEDSLRMRDEHLDTIPKTELDEFIKSSVENLVPNPSESEDDSECDVPACDDFTTFSNLLFDPDDDFSSSDDESFSDEDILKEIYSNPLFDEEIISIKIDPHHFNADDSLMEEIDLSFTPDDSMPPSIENDDYDSEGDILICEELLSYNSLSLHENESFYFDIPSSPLPFAKPSNDDEIEPNSGMLTVIVVGDISEHYVPVPRILPTQPTHDSNQEKSPHLLSHRGLKAFQLSSKSPMMIFGRNTPILDVPFLHFYPL